MEQTVFTETWTCKHWHNNPEHFQTLNVMTTMILNLTFTSVYL